MRAGLRAHHNSNSGPLASNLAARNVKSHLSRNGDW